MKALIFANGSLDFGPMVAEAIVIAQDAVIIAADGGVRHALALDLMPQVVIGDMDSVTPAELATCAAAGGTIIRHAAAKNETDLELALLYAVEQGADWLRIVGALGDRLDQSLANILLLMLPELRHCDVRLVAGRQTAWLLSAGEHQLTGQPGDTLSLIPLGGDVSDVTTTGLVYPLRDEALYFGPARGISNVFAEATATVQSANGLLLAVHTLGRA